MKGDVNYNAEIDIGERLFKLRSARGISQDELAEELNVTRQTISNWENNKVKLDALKAAEICRFYGVSLDSLFAESRFDFPPKEKEDPAPAQDMQKRRGKLYALFAIIVAVAAAAVAAGAAVYVAGDGVEVSSAVTLTEKGGGIFLICFGAAAILAVLITAIVKYLKNK